VASGAQDTDPGLVVGQETATDLTGGFVQDSGTHFREERFLGRTGSLLNQLDGRIAIADLSRGFSNAPDEIDGLAVPRMMLFAHFALPPISGTPQAITFTPWTLNGSSWPEE